MVNDQFAENAKKIKLIATDIDGVWTDGVMYYSPEGEVMKAFSTYDGMAVQLLREAGLEIAILTGENSPSVKARAEKLNIENLFLGEADKLKRIKNLCEKLNISLSEVAYIGDDVNDLEILKSVGLCAMACNSPILHRFSPHYITKREGGKGAFRDFVDQILSCQQS